MTSQSTSDPTKIRYHGLDALRAWAMSLGLVLHAAWIMYPGDAGAPRTDASTSVVMQYVCLAIHTFRMQLFFVLAGLFACLLLRKRGIAKFLKNRSQRIVVPLIAFWLLLCPIMTYQYRAAGIQSGAIQGDVTATSLTWEYFASLQYDNVLLLHLWFLYYLSLTYVIVMACRALLKRIDSQQWLTSFVSDSFGSLLTSKFAVLGLAVVFGIPLFMMDGAWGVEVNLASLVPKWLGLAAYLGYFVVGWLMYRNIDLLPQITAHWRWQLGLGVLLTFGCFAYGKFVPQRGYVTWNYPNIEIEDLIHDDGVPRYSQFRRKLLDAEPSSLPAALFAALPEANRDFLRENRTATDNQLNGLLQTINKTILPQSDWLAGVSEKKSPDEKTESAASPIDDTRTTSDQVARSNRHLIEAAFPQVIHTEDIHRPYYHLQRAGYALMYSLTTWSLIFGCIGFSQYYFDRQSSFWRYFSDASYWFYLAHLPIQFAILMLVGDSPWHWTVKFALYVLGTLAILLPSYHFLIRPSWIGWMLNGRMESVGQLEQAQQVEKDTRMTDYPVAPARDHAFPLERTPMTNIERVTAFPETRKAHE